MATSGEPTAKDSGAASEASSPLPQERLQERESTPDSSSKSSSSSGSPPSSARVTAREGSAADANAPSASIDRDTSIPTLQEARQQPGSYDSGRSTALSYFAPTGAGKISFFPPAGVRPQTNFRIHPVLGPSSRESLRYYTSGGDRTAEQAAPWRAAPAAETNSQGGEPGLIYYSPPPDSCGAALNSSASTRVSSPTAIRREPTQPAVLPASFVQSSLGTFIPQQRLLAGGGRIGAPDTWGQAGATAVDSPQLQQQQYGQREQVDGRRKQLAGTGIPATFFVGTPRQPQYYVEPRAHADMKWPQFYTAAPRPLNEKTWANAAAMKHGLENVAPSRMQPGMQRQILPGSSTDMRQRYQWGEQPPAVRISRGVREGETRRRRRMPWDCCEELMSPRDFLPVFSASQARLSRNLRANLNTRRKDITKVLQRFQGALRHYYQQLIRNIGVDDSCGGRCPPEDAQQTSRGSELWRTAAGERYTSPRFVDKTSLYYTVAEQPTVGEAGDLKKGREATQMLWKDGRILYGPPGVPAELIYTTDQRTAEALEAADQPLGKSLLQLPHREVSALIPQSSSKGVDGTYYTGAASTPSTRACPTCGASQVLVYVDKPPLQDETLAKKYDEGALQRLAHGDVDGCLQRLGEWRCTLCSDVAAAADDEVLHTGGAVQQGGEWVDQMVEILVHGVAETMRGLFLMIPRPSQHVVEGYPLYEPDYTYLTRKGRPTSLTGNFCVDQINAFLDACLVDEGEVSAVVPKAPPVPETTRTGHWLIDAANAALDKLCVEVPPPPPPPKAFCPPIETLLPPCCRDTPLLPPRPPPRQTTVCPCLDIFKSTSRGPALECPHCHQPLRSGVCPVESPRERRFKHLFEECLSQNKKATVSPAAAPLYAYEAPPVGYYVPSTAKQPATEYYTPVYSSSPATAAVGKQTNERIYYTPAAATAGPQPSEWAEPAALVSSSGKTDACQYPNAPVYATQPYSKGFTVSGERVFAQPLA